MASLKEDPLNRIATTSDLATIARHAYFRWEKLASKILPKYEVDYINKDFETDDERMYQVLLKWSRREAGRATLKNLFCLMFQAGLSDYWNLGETASSMKMTENQIRDCATGVQTNSLITPSDDSLGATVYDGRLIQLDETEINTISEACSGMENLIGHGAFGTVYHVKQEEIVKTFGMDVAVKKVANSTKSVRKEMIVSRILHPFIVPMLTTFRSDETTFYFVYPLFEKKDLHGVLHECNLSENDCQTFHAVRRIRVCCQVASALKYLHTEVPEVRSAVLHKDVCSQNILLDACYNARLTDFGSAREQDDTTSTASVRDTYSHPDIGTGKTASKHWDYFAFGVVVREILTGLDPKGDGNCYLKNMEEDLDGPENRCLKFVQRDHKTKSVPLQKNVWPEDELDIPRKLCAISTKCLKAKDDGTPSDESGQFEFSEIVRELKEMLKKTGNFIMARDETEQSKSTKCDVCMFNEAAQKTHRRTCREECRQTVQICMPCEKNSFLNPLICYTCGSGLKREIGDDWGALLVAGPDDDVKYAKAFKTDVQNVRNVILSKAPVIMGIREEHIIEVFPDEGEIVPSIFVALKKIGNDNNWKTITTLMIYFSCHGKGDKVQSNEDNGQTKDIRSNGKKQSLETVQKNQGEGERNMEQKRKHENDEQVDGQQVQDFRHENAKCDTNEQIDQKREDSTEKETKPKENSEKCQNFLLGTETLSFSTFQNELTKLSQVKTFIIILDMCHAPKMNIEGKNVLQINSCAEDQKSRAISDGSTFTTFLIQGLKGASEKFSCFLEKRGIACKICRMFLRKDDEFLSVVSLFDYIKEHMGEKRYIEGEKEDIQKPVINVCSADEVNIAYNTKQPVRIQFEVEVKKQRKTVYIDLEYFTDLVPLRKRLYKETGCSESKEKMTIMAKTYRGDRSEVECDSLGKVMAAWINRNQLIVKFEQFNQASSTVKGQPC